MDFEAVFQEIGKFGKYQKLLLAVLSIPHLLGASYIYIQVLTVQDTEHHCRSWKDDDCSWLNLTDFECMELKRNLSVPFTGDHRYGNVTEDQCHKFNVTGVSLQSAVLASDDWLNATGHTIECDDGWVFSRAPSSSSMIVDVSLKYHLNFTVAIIPHTVANSCYTCPQDCTVAYS